MSAAGLQQKVPRIMVVDDDPMVQSLLESILVNGGSQVCICGDGHTALEEVERYRPDLILLDIKMPGMDGFQVCERLKLHPRCKEIPVIFLSGLEGPEEKVKGFQVGGVDYITKPFNIEEIQARIGTHLNLCSLRYRLEYQKLIDSRIREISEAQQATIFALAKLAEQRDEDTGVHLENVREYCRLLAQYLSRNSTYAAQVDDEFIECIQYASPLHDIGKVAIPDSILLKPGKLTREEFETMKSHAVIGGENLQTVFNRYADNVFIGMGIEIALYHHERWDGSGYPDGLVGRNIPLSARIMALADCYDALCSDRCYRKGFSHAQARDMIVAESGTHFDPEIVKAFLALEHEFMRVMNNR